MNNADDSDVYEAVIKTQVWPNPPEAAQFSTIRFKQERIELARANKPFEKETQPLIYVYGSSVGADGRTGANSSYEPSVRRDCPGVGKIKSRASLRANVATRPPW